MEGEEPKNSNPGNNNIETLDVNEIFNKKEKQDENQAQETSKTVNSEQTENSESNENKNQDQKGSFLTTLLDIALNLIIVFGLVFIIQTFIASPFKVYGPSMCNTINYINDECVHGYGEYIIVNKLIYKNFFGFQLSKPKRGDIIVFHPPHSKDQFYIKRIIGVPGDTIKLIDGKVYLFNDQYETGYELPEPYLSPENKDNTQLSTNRENTFKVPEGKYFVLGDNRTHSTDSRSCFRDVFEGGCRGKPDYFLPKENIEGKASVVLWPLNKIRTFPDINYFPDKTNSN